jgi:hypothetical protein
MEAEHADEQVIRAEASDELGQFGERDGWRPACG